MYILENKNQPTPIEETTFADLNMLERDIEEMLRLNIDMLCETDEESMLIVGQQVRNEQNGRSDLTAIDNNGNIVLIEVKRDVNDIANRKEPFEFQAIRYAASCATLKSTSELVQNLFAPYVEKHRSEFTKEQNLTATEIATRKLDEFIKFNRNFLPVIIKRARRRRTTYEAWRGFINSTTFRTTDAGAGIKHDTNNGNTCQTIEKRLHI